MSRHLRYSHALQKSYRADLLKVRAVGRWYENVARGSRITADVYLRRLGGFCSQHAILPTQLIRSRPKALQDLLLDTVTDMGKQGYAGSYIASVIKAVKSWLAFNDIELRRPLKIRGATDTPTLVNERVPSREELRRILLAGDPRARLVCGFLASTGVRPQSLGNYLGDDGLRIRDIPEMRIEGKTVAFKMVPAMIRVRANLSKKRLEYFTFMGSEGCDYLKTYLTSRLQRGERLTPDSPIVTPRLSPKPFMCTINIGDVARQAIRKAGLQAIPYVLRHYFDTQLMVAESKGPIIRDYRTFFMGHKGDIEAVYTLHKRMLPQEVVDGMREAYSKAQRYLATDESASRQEELTRAFKRQLLLVVGFGADEIGDEQLELEEDGFHELVRNKLVDGTRDSQPTQTVVDVEDVENHLREGWQFVDSLPGNKAIVKKGKAL